MRCAPTTGVGNHKTPTATRTERLKAPSLVRHEYLRHERMWNDVRVANQPTASFSTIGRLITIAAVLLGVTWLAAGAAVAQDNDALVPTSDRDALVTWSCLAPRGRVDVQLANRSESRQTFVVRVGNDEREIVVAGRNLARVSFTNVRDGAQTVRADRVRVQQMTRVPVIDTVVTIACEQPGVGSVSTNEVDLLAACRGTTVVQVRMANPTPEARVYVIDAVGGEGAVPERSTTTAAPFGVTFRTLTLATDAPATITVSSSGRGVLFSEVVDADCDAAQTATANNRVVAGASSTSVWVAHAADAPPVVAYQRKNTDSDVQLSFGSLYPSDLAIIRCADAACRSVIGEPTSVLTGGFEDLCCTRTRYRPLGMQLSAAGNPIILYGYARGTWPNDGEVESYEGLVICDDPTCATGGETVTRSLPNETGYRLDAILTVGSDGSPVVLASATGPDQGRLIVRCQDSLCSEVEAQPVVTGGEHDGGADNPSWWTDGVLYTCNDADCTGGLVRLVEPPLVERGEFSSFEGLLLISVAQDPLGRPAWLYRARNGTVADRRMQLMRCADVLCDPAGVTITTIYEPDPGVWTYAPRSLQIGPDGRPLVVGTRLSSRDEPDVWVTTCLEVGCARQATRVLDPAPSEYEFSNQRHLATVHLDAASVPLILSSRTDSESYWTIEATKCTDFDCSDGSAPSEPGAEVDIIVSCFQGSGRADAYVRNLTGSRLDGSIVVDGVADHTSVLDARDLGRITQIGLGDGRATITARASTRRVNGVVETVQVRKDVSFDCGDGGIGAVALDPNDSRASEWRVMSGCVDGAGVIELYRTSAEGGSFVVESAELGNRSTTATPLGLARIRYGAVADGTYPLTVRGHGSVTSVEIECAATVVASCLAGRGRVDIVVRNASAAARTIEVVFGALTPRVAAVAAGDLHRFALTGRRDGEHAVAVRAIDDAGNSVSLLSDVVTIDCGPDAMASSGVGVNEIPWTAVAGCRSGAGVIEMVAVSPLPQKFQLATQDLQRRRIQVTEPFGLARFVIDGVVDGTYDLVLQANDRQVATVTIDCGA